MEKVISFIVENWRLFAECCAALVAFVMFMVRKKPVNDIWVYIYQVCLVAVNKAEELDHDGYDKLRYAINFVVEALEAKYPGCDAYRYTKLIEQTIELILSTPQKKGEKRYENEK